MRPELERLRLIEDYLHQRLSPDQLADLQVRLLIEPDLYEELESQKQTYATLQAAGRRQLRGELEQIHQQLYGRKGYAWLVVALFGFLVVAVGCWLL